MKLRIDAQNHVELIHKNDPWTLAEDIGFSPLETLVAAAAACSTYVFRKILDKQRIDYTIQSVQADYEEGTSKPLSRIDILFILSVDDTHKEKIEKDLKLVPKHCTVVRCLDPAIEVNEHVVFS